ncbi:MAG TPA: sulfotransferase [Vicinamibacterales bacterium]|jgi:tetratricopeptide (TPR) repeat protein
MNGPPAERSIDGEVHRIRECSRRGRHHEALAAAELLAEMAPDHRDVLYLIAANQRCLNQIRQALATLQRLEQQHPRFSLLHQERGYCYATLRDAPRAIAAFLEAVTLNPLLWTSWMMLEFLYRVSGDVRNATAAGEHVSSLKQLPREVVRAGSLCSDGEFSAAEGVLRAHVASADPHVEGTRLLARLERQRGALDEAERRLEAALTRGPENRDVRTDYVCVLIDRQRYREAREAMAPLLIDDARDRQRRSLYAAACVGLGEHEQAIAAYRELLADSPTSAELHVSLGHVLQTVGRTAEAVECYRHAAAVRPSFGDAYWSLANLKTYRFSPREIACMQEQEAALAATRVDRCHLCFALGKAFEDRHEYARSWQHYERGNALKRADSRYAREITDADIRRQTEVCTSKLFAARQGVGAPDRDPMFIVGMPRSGSTLVEQILASHSRVESTHELFDVQRLVIELQGRRSIAGDPGYPGLLPALAPDEFRVLGERYLGDTRAYRTSKPFFIDKMPNNFRHVGLIHLMLPNATIIDVRREPMACCFSNLKQLFAGGQEFTYSAEDVAHYYRRYLDLMRHWDEVLPRRILRVSYEDLVDDLEGNVRRILEWCGLEFEGSCVEFHKSKRSVRTPSAEQVRQPMFREGLLQWRHYERWLGPLEGELGDELIRYRE